MPLTNPPLIPEAFASLGDKNTIPDAPGAPGAASWDSGFPVETEEPLTSGGIPPDRLDVNGVLFSMSQHTAFLQAGGVYKWDAALGAVGYAEGTTLLLNDNVTLVTSLLDANTTNPNSSMVGWQFANANAAPNFNAPTTGGAINAYTLTTSATPHGQSLIISFVVQSAHTNTGASTINVNGLGAVPITYFDGSPLKGGELVASLEYFAISWDLGSSYRLLLPFPAVVVPALFGTIHDVTASRVLGTTYTNTSTLPMFVSVQGTSNGASVNLSFLNAGVTVFTFGQPNTASSMGCTGMVPPGGTYSVVSTGAGVTVNKWIETY